MSTSIIEQQKIFSQNSVLPETIRVSFHNLAMVRTITASQLLIIPSRPKDIHY